ncbi:MAG: TIR domain-containing protein [Flectobacillus sp.]|nr:TIR domain-containing protein [Flectobacillus sp.]
MSLLNSIKKSIFGYDIFISYSRKDSLDYAYAIAQYFMKKDLDCYIDQLSSITPGKELPSNIIDAVKNSTSFVLIGSICAQSSEAIDQEIELFLKNNKNKPLIPITINGAINVSAIWQEKIWGLALIDDSLQNLDKGTPEQDVLDRIANSLQFTKRSRRLRNISLSVILGILTITALATFYTINARNDADTALKERSVAEQKRDTAIRQKNIAQKQMSEAMSVRDQAKSQKEIADSLRFLSDKIAKANSIVSSASSLLNNDPTKGFDLAKQALSVYPTVEGYLVLFKAYIFAPFYKSVAGSLAKLYPNGKNIAVIDYHGTVSIYDWDIRKNHRTYTIEHGFNPQMCDWKISSGNDLIIVNSKDSIVPFKTINLITGKTTILNNLITDTSEELLQISNNGKKLATFLNNRIIIYTITGSKLVKEKEIKSSIPVSHLQVLFCPDDTTIVIWSANTLKLQNYITGKIYFSDDSQDNIYEVVVSDNINLNRFGEGCLYISSKKGEFIISFKHNPKKPEIINLESITGPRTLTNRGVEHLSLSRNDNRFIISQFNSTNPIVADTRHLFPQYSLIGGHSSNILSSTFSNDNILVMTGSEDKLAIIWDRGNIKHILKGHTKPIVQVFISNDNKKALTVGFHENIKFWNLDIKDNSTLRDLINTISYDQTTKTYFLDGLNTYITPKYIIKSSL